MTDQEAINVVQNVLNNLRASMLYRSQHDVIIELNDFMLEDAFHIVLLKARKNIRLEGVEEILTNAKKRRE